MNKYIKIIVSVIAVIVIILLVKGLINKKQPTSDQVIKIGAVLSLTGSASADGEAIKQGLELAKEDLAEKGINVEIIYQDDQTNPKETISAVNIVANQGAQGLIGPTWSFLGSATLPVIDRLQLTTIMPATTTEVVEGKSKYLFHGSLKTELMQKDFEDFFVKNSIKKVALIGNNDAWSGSIAKPIYAAAKNTGTEIVIHEQLTYGSEAGAMPVIIGKIKQEAPDVVILSIFDEEGIVKLVTETRNQGIMIPILSSDTTLQRIIKEGILDTKKYTNLYNVIPKNDESFEDKFIKRFGSEPRVYTDRGYDALMILVEGILNKDDLPLEQYINTKINYSGYASQYDFDDNGDIIGGEWEIKKI